MSAELSDTQIQELKQALEKQYRALREQIRQALLAADEEQYIELAGLVHDLEEESVADLLVDINLASIDRHIRELQAVDAALLRISTGNYGSCIDCDSPIGYPRLKADPSVSRCLECQTKFEQSPLHKR